MEWTKQGAAAVAPIQLLNGARGRIVLVGARENPKGAMVLVPGSVPASVDTRPLEQHLDHLAPMTIVEIICMQERLFGESGLPVPH